MGLVLSLTRRVDMYILVEQNGKRLVRDERNTKFFERRGFSIEAVGSKFLMQCIAIDLITGRFL